MSRISEILAVKGSQVHSVAPQTSVHEAVALMVQHNIGSLLVLDGDETTGIFTERDHLRRVTLPNRDPKTTPVGEVMTDRVIYVDPERTVEECMGIMTQQRIRHLPVIRDNHVIGMISIGDLVRHVSNEREVEIHHLTKYITGSL
jgi:CBS domain-containing protein